MERENEHSSLLENAVVKNDRGSLKSLLNGEIYKLGHLKVALVKAVEANNVDVVQLLLDHVQAWQEIDALCVVFSAAAKLGREELMRFVVSVKLRRRSLPCVALWWAAEHGHSEWIKPLLDNGADVNSTDGHTALDAAAVKGHVDCLTTLIEHGAEVNAGAGSCVGTPLHRAADWDNTECVTALLRHGADVNSSDRKGYSPLHCAAECGHVDCFEKLVQSGADTMLKDNKNKTALDVADDAVKSGDIKESTKQQLQLIVNTFQSQKSVSRETDACVITIE